MQAWFSSDTGRSKSINLDRWEWEQEHGIGTLKRYREATTRHREDLCREHFTCSRNRAWFVCKDTGKRKMIFLRIWLWEEAHGPPPKGYYVYLIDPDSPVEIDNLNIFTKADRREDLAV
tara:strand:- start:11443 stop:11799 length:357 start_codon:yes stop_codon:yes gene_type:complete